MNLKCKFLPPITLHRARDGEPSRGGDCDCEAGSNDGCAGTGAGAGAGGDETEMA